jgi:NAD(P)-dependent dehydrogenase (short-subunit alcohol dehydrogenase family)
MGSGTSLTGRVALVTGGGRGLGRAHARALARRGAAVVVNDLGCGVDGHGRDHSVAETVAAEITAHGGQAVADSSDVGSFVGAANCVERAREQFGRIDIVVNNAGILGGSRLASLDEQTLDRVLAVHLKGTLGTARAALSTMQEQRYGRFINIVSEAALDERRPAGIAYGAAKAAVWSVTLALAVEGVPYGITANAISPAARTRMNDRLLASRTPLDLDLDPRHVAELVAYLASDAARDITGRVIHAAGGELREYFVRRVRHGDLLDRLRAAHL